jgi:hypothetical protein
VNQFLNQQLNANPQTLLIQSTNILVNVTYPIEVRRMASIAICSSITPRNSQLLLTIRRWWRSSRDLTSQVKDALSHTVVCEDEVLQNQASHAFALILLIEGEKGVETLTEHSQLLQMVLNNPIQAYGLLNIFLEILHLEWFENELKTPILLESYFPF